MSRPPHIAVIGYGSWGRQHARALRELGALRWVYDANPVMSADAPERTSFISNIWDDECTDGVVIATPPGTHKELAVRALQAGKHVLVEKPMAMTVDDCVYMISAAQRAGRVLMAGHTMRYHTGFQALLIRLDADAGRREYVYSHRLQPGRVRTDSSSLWQLAPHDISMLIAVAGCPLAVTCTQGVSRAGLADIITATLEFSNGVRGHFFVSWLHPAKQREFMVIGERGALTFEQAAPPVEPLRAELQHFLGCIGKGRQPLTDGIDGRRVVRVLEACDRSMKAGGTRIECQQEFIL